ncbi:MAG: hypothetical protein JNL63_11875 [Bacteroidia bacterium]|nr:hypothetical protein [Bacteroidia bacterium]
MKRGAPFGAPLKHHRNCTKGGMPQLNEFAKGKLAIAAGITGSNFV